MSVISRLIPHAANFTIIGAAIIFLSRKYNPKIASIFALALMIFTDLFLGFSFTSVFVYAGFIMYAFFAQIGKKQLWGLLAAPIIGSLAFFIISNFGVFIGPWYPHTAFGLANCFIAALPFYRNMVAGDIVFTAAIFGFDYIYNCFLKTKIREGLWDKKLQKGILIKR